ncbi:group 3 secretory phospholipase A2 isoform X2 [Protopterus annectens]|nr:group 3 secretory phospholipase A2 isoform X2 [Protopterus annectens]
MFRETDKCCRKHDHCKHMIHSFDYGYGVFNYRLHTISLCSCDFRFKQCLLNQNDTVSTIVGVTYFNVLQVPCFVLQNKRRCPRNSNCRQKKAQVATIRYQGNYNYTHPYQDEWDEYYRARHPNRHRHLNATKLSLPELTSKTEIPKNGSKAHESKEITTASPSAESSKVVTFVDMPSGDQADEDSQTKAVIFLDIPSGDKADEGSQTDIIHTINWTVPLSKIHRTTVYNEVFSKQMPENISVSPLNTSETFLYYVPENTAHSPLNTSESLSHVPENYSLSPLNMSEVLLHSLPETISRSSLNVNTSETFLHHIPESISLSPLNASETFLNHPAKDMSISLNTLKAFHHSLTTQESTSSMLLMSKSSHHSTGHKSKSTHSTLSPVSERTTLRPTMELENTLSMPTLWFGKENQNHVNEADINLPHQNPSRNHSHSKDTGGKDADFTRIKEQLKNQYISKGCGCYRRFDECEYKIAPNDILFHLQNLDKTTLYHCNCTRRLARQLRKLKGVNEVEEVLPQYVSPLCFNLRYSTTCTSTEGCTENTTAILAEARHLQRAIKYRKRRKPLAVPLKVKRHGDDVLEEKAPKPVRLYDKCLQFTQALQQKD